MHTWFRHLQLKLILHKFYVKLNPAQFMMMMKVMNLKKATSYHLLHVKTITHNLYTTDLNEFCYKISTFKTMKSIFFLVTGSVNRRGIARNN